MNRIKFTPLSEQALMLYAGHQINKEVHILLQYYIDALTVKPFDGLVEIVPGYTNICLYYNPLVVRASKNLTQKETIAATIQDYIESTIPPFESYTPKATHVIEIPVMYGGEAGPDLQHVADVNGLTCEEVIAIHTSTDYLVHMLGFAPGFPFLGGVDQRIATPRRATPRLRIEAGSVGIAGEQTGIYPLATPGGWQIIGRTTVNLFLPEHHPPTLLRAGDTVRFVAVTEEMSC